MLLHLLFFFNDTATTEIYTLSLHDALPISRSGRRGAQFNADQFLPVVDVGAAIRERRMAPKQIASARSEEHTSELQSLRHLVCRLLLEKKKKKKIRKKNENLNKRRTVSTHN